MKKSLLFLFLALLLFGAPCANATPYTWVDSVTIHKFLSAGDSYSYTHDLTDNTPPFVVGQDLITSYSLTLGLRDDGGFLDGPEIYTFDQPGALGDSFRWDLSDPTFGWSLEGLVELNMEGTLDIKITSVVGDFWLENSTLTATGCENTPVPEPSALLLLGAGFAGLATLRTRRRAHA